MVSKTTIDIYLSVISAIRGIMCFVKVGRNFKIHRITRWINAVSWMSLQSFFLTLTERHKFSIYTHVNYLSEFYISFNSWRLYWGFCARNSEKSHYTNRLVTANNLNCFCCSANVFRLLNVFVMSEAWQTLLSELLHQHSDGVRVTSSQNTRRIAIKLATNQEINFRGARKL